MSFNENPIPHYLHGLEHDYQRKLVEAVVKAVQPGSSGLQRILEALESYKRGPDSREESRTALPSAAPDQATLPVLRIQLDVVQGRVV